MNPPDGTPASHRLQIIEHVACRLCCQPIDARASRCPFCHAPQQPPRRWNKRLVRAGIIARSLTLTGTVVWLTSSRAQLLTERQRLQTQLEQRERRSEPTAIMAAPDAEAEPERPLQLALWQEHADTVARLCRTQPDTPPCRRLIAAIEKQVPAYLAASRQTTEETWTLCSSGRQMLSTIEGMEHGRLANIREALAGATNECPQL